MKPIARRDPVRAKEATDEDTYMMLMMMMMTMMMARPLQMMMKIMMRRRRVIIMMRVAKNLQLVDQWHGIVPQSPKGSC